MPKVPHTQELVYPEIKVAQRTGDRPLTAKELKDLLGWETEDAYKERYRKEAGGDVHKGAKAVTGFGDDYLLKDEFGNKVRCWNNMKNRPFGEPWARALAQVILSSGPELPKEKREWQFNGESMIIGNMGQVLSGQHRGIGLILAVQMWEKDPEKYPSWPHAPTLESIVVVGIDESLSTVRTLDNVKPRSLSDVFYTSDHFRDKKYDRDSRHELSKQLATAVGLLWKRTGVDTKYQTHGESISFLDRHPTLLNCVKHIFQENKEGRVFSNGLKVSAGLCEGLMYLMAASQTDPVEYQQVRSEKAVDLSMYDTAQDFFTLLSAGDSRLAAIKEEIGALLETEDAPRVIEKLSILVKGWNEFAHGGALTRKNLSLAAHWVEEDGKMKFVDAPSVGGIDAGETKISEEEKSKNPSPEELEAQKEEARKQRAAELDAKAKEAAKRLAQRGVEKAAEKAKAATPNGTQKPTTPAAKPVSAAQPKGKTGTLRGGL